MTCLVNMPTMPKYHSKFSISFYARLVSFSNIILILSNRTYIIEFVVSSHARFSIIGSTAVSFEGEKPLFN